MRREVEVLPDKAALTARAAELFLEIAEETPGDFRVALAGGSTPKDLYAALVDRPVPWGRTRFYWGDERCVPPEHADSNYRMAREALLSKVPVPPENIHRIQAERPDAAELYEAELEGRFDLVLLGMGPDGHTASLFPDTEALREAKRLVLANWVPKLGARRITLTYPALNAARNVLFLVSGPDKARAAGEVLREGKVLPAGLVRPADGRLIWLLDRPAAG